ncbi:hypothetical protein SDC9_104468 [bioreactor metagenome]|uniref:DIX domain-containing protein n=1 Tax=bioreactor metagenome TaxID=1076179 RepID=A0A645AWM0_9ZZZZ
MSPYKESFYGLFLSQTKQILNKSADSKYHFTQLINCTLALFSILLERVQDEQGYRKFFLRRIIAKMETLDMIAFAPDGITDYGLLCCFRNAMTHSDVSSTKPFVETECFADCTIMGTANNHKYQCTFTISEESVKQLSVFIIDMFSEIS